jgi:hypothetical protein
LLEIKPHLVAEQAERARARAITALDAALAHHPEKVEIGLHDGGIPRF